MEEKKVMAYTVQSVNEALELLEALTEFPSGLKLAQLAKKIGENHSKTFRLMSTLCDKGLVAREGGAYRLGIYSMTFAHKFLKNAHVINYAHPTMEVLAKKHDEAVYIAVIKDDEVLFVDMVDCEQRIKATSFVGRRFPLFTNAAGKVMKALDSRDLLEKMFKKRDSKSGYAEMDKLESELTAIRARGVAIDIGGLGEGVISVAVAFRDYAGKVVGAITLIGPSFRMLAERLENEIVPSMLEGGELLSEKFGYARA